MTPSIMTSIENAGGQGRVEAVEGGFKGEAPSVLCINRKL